MLADSITVTLVLERLFLALLIGAMLGYERRAQHKAIGISGMLLVALGSTTVMLFAQHEEPLDPGAVGRTIQGMLQGIGFLAGAVVFKTGSEASGVKTAAAIWITGAIGLALGTALWQLGVITGLATVSILFVADLWEARQRQGQAQGANNEQSTTD